MAYLFGAGNTDKNDCGTSVSKASTFSLGVRFAPTQAINNAFRKLAAFSDGITQSQFFLYLDGSGGANNIVAAGFSKAAGTAFPSANFTSGFTAGGVHTVFFTYDGANLNLYADTDASPKASVGESGTPDQVAGQHFCIGGELSLTQSADSTIYEVGWWPGTALTGAQAAALGAGNASGITLPTDYWALVDSPKALYGGHDGTVTGASLVTHVGNNLYGAGPLVGARRSGLVRAA